MFPWPTDKTPALRLACMVALAAPGGAGAEPEPAGAPLAPPQGVIEYLAPENAIWLRGFPRTRPATPEDVRAADAAHGWGKTAYDPAADTTTLDASLWIGHTAAWAPTYAQIGRPGHERETLVVRGNVWIRPPRRAAPRSDGRSGLINRLTLGDPGNPAIRANLKIACASSGQYGILIGHRDRELGITYGGELAVYHGTITAADPVPERRLGGAPHMGNLNGGWYAARVELANATVSWIDGSVSYGLHGGGTRVDGLQMSEYRIEGSRFEHCGTVLEGHGAHTVSDCRFERMTAPAISGNRITCVRCAFADNEAHWELLNRAGIAVELIDCEIGPARRPLQLRKNTQAPRQLLAQRIPVYPFYLERRSCVVDVRDGTGAPIAHAVVSLHCPDDPQRESATAAAVRCGNALTGPDGRTPARIEDGALLAATRRLQATDDPLRPREDELIYELTVDAAGFRGVRGPVATAALGAPLPVRLERVVRP